MWLRLACSVRCRTRTGRRYRTSTPRETRGSRLWNRCCHFPSLLLLRSQIQVLPWPNYQYIPLPKVSKIYHWTYRLSACHILWASVRKIAKNVIFSPFTQQNRQTVALSCDSFYQNRYLRYAKASTSKRNQANLEIARLLYRSKEITAILPANARFVSMRTCRRRWWCAIVLCRQNSGYFFTSV